MGGPSVTLRERFLAKIEPEPTSGCWLWTGALNREGYGQIWIAKNQPKPMVHRYAYMELTGQDIPDGFVIDHLCRVRSCVNPDHLEAVTPRVNTYRCPSPPSRNGKKTHCKHGHELSGRNLFLHEDRNGPRRDCRECGKLKTRRYRARRKGAIQR